MAEKTKKIIKFGNGIGITIDRPMQFSTGFKEGDNIIVKCSPNKIIIIKNREE